MRVMTSRQPQHYDRGLVPGTTVLAKLSQRELGGYCRIGFYWTALLRAAWISR
jgi:hypothetical protein